jgi:hypothetical protein
MYAANASSETVRRAMTEGQLGQICTPNERRAPLPGVTWCADNGCFSTNYVGDDRWLAWLRGLAPHAARCMFAVAPDVVGNAADTYERSTPWLPVIRELGFKAAYAAQDGQELFDPPWDDLDCLFIGGSTEWKLGPHVAPLVREAKARGKWVHAGRVNSTRRFAHFELMGCDSADGTYLAFGPDVNLPRVLHWTNSLFSDLPTAEGQLS